MRLFFPPGEYVFGRNAENDVVLVHRCASRTHFLLRVTDDGAFVRDLQSRNGITVNYAVVKGDHPLRDGNRLFVGGIRVCFAVQILPGEHGVPSGDAPRPVAIYQQGASPDEATVAPPDPETVLITVNPA
jgi:pSer/pThr/pTyr-binding forkhead associated (FHA) protein